MNKYWTFDKFFWFDMDATLDPNKKMLKKIIFIDFFERFLRDLFINLKNRPTLVNFRPLLHSQ